MSGNDPIVSSSLGDGETNKGSESSGAAINQRRVAVKHQHRENTSATASAAALIEAQDRDRKKLCRVNIFAITPSAHQSADRRGRSLSRAATPIIISRNIGYVA